MDVYILGYYSGLRRKISRLHNKWLYETGTNNNDIRLIFHLLSIISDIHEGQLYELRGNRT